MPAGTPPPHVHAGQTRLSAAVYGLVAVAILVVVAVVGLSVAPPTTPTTAEFSPGAANTVPDAVAAQALPGGDGGCVIACAPGEGAGGGPGGTTSTTGLPGAPTTTGNGQVERARVLRCVGTPPRQTEDPQSPPCVNYFDGDNGGATTRGISRDDILVVAPCEESCSYISDDLYAALVRHVNHRYQLYGRKLRLERVALDKSTGVGDDPVKQRATADLVDEKAPFAALGLGTRNDTTSYHRELARHRIVGINHEGDSLSDADLRSLSPYLWTYAPSTDQLAVAAGEMTCTSLHGRPPRAGATGALSGQPRRFGALVPTGTSRTLTDRLRSALARCDEALDVQEVGDAQVALAALQARGVTTVFLAGNATMGASVQQTATLNGYEPEWVVLGQGLQEEITGYQALWTPNQRDNLFGLATRSTTLDRAERPASKAALDEGFVPDNVSVQPLVRIYAELLLLASGIQAAGPRLTPETFAAGLERTRFANPDAGRAPFRQASVGFGPGDHTIVDDVGALWWSDSASSKGDGQAPRGAWCYVGGGARFRPGGWPKEGVAFFRPGDCAAGP